MYSTIPITYAKGDGIGPEIMDAALKILTAAECPLALEEIKIGKTQYEQGHTSGIAPDAWESLRRTKVFLKAPITTPLGGGYKSLNVTIRKGLGLFANVRPSISYHPFVKTYHPKMDLVIIRENEEDLYAGIEHQQTKDTVQCLKLISVPGCERILRYAFEFTKTHGRKKVTCLSKNNIMKLTDGLFSRMFHDIGNEYPEIQKEHMIIDIGAAKLATRPENFDVIVTLNLYGDIVSDITAEVSGSVGLAGSSNIGTSGAMFEAIHGSAPDIAGKGIANPSGLIQASVMMLSHIGLTEKAALIQNAWSKTIEDGIHTGDVYNEGVSSKKVSCSEFCESVIKNLGSSPKILRKKEIVDEKQISFMLSYKTPMTKVLKGVDIFLDNETLTPNELGEKLSAIKRTGINFKMLTNRGIKVYPDGLSETLCTNHFRARFASENPLDNRDIISLLSNIEDIGLSFIKIENLYEFDGVKGYSAAQGE